MTDRKTEVPQTSPWLYPILLVAVVGAVLLSVFVGRYPEPYWMPARYLWQDVLARRLVVHLRLPRTLTALLMGMVLAAAGTVMQTIFRNPLVCAGFLGVSQGAAFGAALSIVLLTPSPMIIEGFATVFALAGLLLSYVLAWNIRYGDWVLRLVLAGIVSSALFSSGVGVLKYLADPLKELPDIVFWLMGGLWAVTWRDMLYVVPVAAVTLGLLLVMRHRLNLLALQDETAFSLGVSPFKERIVVLTTTVIGTAVVVSVGGIVGWVGLIVPHIARRIVGANAARVLPVSMLIGGVLALLCDDLARTIRAAEIPLGIVTSLIGSAIFMVMFFQNDIRGQA